MRKKIVFLGLIAVLLSCGNGKDSQTAFTQKATENAIVDEMTEQRIDSLYEKMSIDERVAQLQCMYMEELFDSNGKLDTDKCSKLIPFGIGHIPQFAGNSVDKPENLRNKVLVLQQWLVNNTPNGIPALFHEEMLSGFCMKGSTIYPQQIGQACSFNIELASLKTRQTASVARQMGGFLALSPMVDVIRNPYFNRLEESYGEDSYLSAALGTAFVCGLQEGGLKKGVPACSKHFLGYGGGAEATEQELYEEILLPHETMTRVAGSKVIMPGYHEINGTYATVNSVLMNEIMREYIGFNGMFVTDYGAMDQPLIDEDPLKRASMAINAGIDVEFQNRKNFKYLPQAIEKGLVNEKTLEDAVKRVLRLKAAVGLLDKNPQFCTIGDISLDTPEERRTAYDIASQSVVLLKNNDVLPIKGGKKIALVGPNANSMWAMLGDYTYPSMNLFWRNIDLGNINNQVITLHEGITSRMPKGCSVEYECGIDWVEKADVSLKGGGDIRAFWLDKSRRISHPDVINLDKALSIATNSDIIVAAMGENPLLCGENRDRGGLRLPGEQESFVRKLIQTGKPIVLVMFGGRAQVIGDLADKCSAVIQAWYPGEEGGNAVADIIYGNINPSGKLSVGYPKEELNENICYNNNLGMDKRLQWPFGFGLSYTEFQYSNLKVDKQISTTDEMIHLCFDVTNSGKVDGDEIVQIYISPDSHSQLLKPIKLSGFARVSLKAGETKTMNFIMSPQQFGYYNQKSWHIKTGDYQIKVGASSVDIRQKATISLTGEQNDMTLRDVYFTELTSITNK